MSSGDAVQAEMTRLWFDVRGKSRDPFSGFEMTVTGESSHAPIRKLFEACGDTIPSYSYRHSPVWSETRVSMYWMSIGARSVRGAAAVSSVAGASQGTTMTYMDKLGRMDIFKEIENLDGLKHSDLAVTAVAPELVRLSQAEYFLLNAPHVYISLGVPLKKPRMGSVVQVGGVFVHMKADKEFTTIGTAMDEWEWAMMLSEIKSKGAQAYGY